MSIIRCTRMHLASAAALLAAAALAVLFAFPLSAQAMEVERWTAQPNDDALEKVMGATPTRVTWQGQTAEDESLSALAIDLPEGSSVDAENVKVTVMNGLDRLDVASKVQVDGGSLVTVTFPEATPAGSLVMVECNRTLLPGDGGTFGLTGSYTTADGQTLDMPASDKTFDVVSTSPAEQLSTWLGMQDWVKAWNSNKFLHLFFDPSIIVTSVPVVFSGWLIAIALVIVSFPLAIPIGLLWSFMRMAKSRVPRALGATYINIVRGTPLFLQIYIAFFGLPLAGVQIPNIPLGVIVLFMNSGAYLCEIFRAGIQSIPKGQFEASRSLGMNGAQTMLFVIIPQTVRRVIPTMTSEFILLYKDTSMLAAVGVMEIVMYAKTIVAATGSITPYIVAALFYLVITLPLAKVVGKLEARLAGNDTGQSTPKRKKRAKKRGVVKDMSHRPAAETRDAVDAARGSGANTGITPEQMSSL